MNDTTFEYSVVRGFAFSAIFWLIIGLVIGLLIGVQLVYPSLNLTPWLSYGRLRPIHTNGLAFGFGLAGIFACSYYILQRLTKVPLVFPRLAKAHLWIFNAAIAAAAVSLFAGMNTSKEYAELEWPLDVGVVIIWVMFAINVYATIIKRKEKLMYVSLWYIIAMTLAVAVLYIINNLEIPVTLFKSYSLFAGANDANVEWWYGHNAVGFVFTVPILAMFYYFLPKTANVPIYSHRLSMIAFWSVVFAYLWSGAHHLMLTPIPEWLQTMAITFTIFLIAPSWGSVVNGYYTMRGNWDQMRSNYLVKFFILGITFYGLQTVQGPTQGLRTLTQFLHYTEYIPGHVHMGTMGWVTMVICASLYYMIPRLYGKEQIYSIPLANLHFWLILIGQLLYTVTLWIGGFIQGATWQDVDNYSWIQTVTPLYLYWGIRVVGGLIYFVGIVVFTYNLIKTATTKEQRA